MLGPTGGRAKATVMLFQDGITHSQSFFMLLQTISALALVCGLAYMLFRWVVPSILPGTITGRSSHKLVRVIEVTTLDTRRSLYVVEVTGRWLVIGSSESGLQLLSELDAETAEQATTNATIALNQRTSLNHIAAGLRKSIVEQMTSWIKKGIR